jgi:hypothetical protein
LTICCVPVSHGRGELSLEPVSAVDDNDRKERFSLAYISAVAAHAGYLLVESRPVDKDSVDGQLVGDEGRRPRIEFQAKATAREVLRGDRLLFPLSIKNYDDLRLDSRVPRLLIVVLLPTNDVEWLAHSEDELRLRHCGYWLSLAGRPATANAASISVIVPRIQMFDTAQLSALMGRADRGEPL